MAKSGFFAAFFLRGFLTVFSIVSPKSLLKICLEFPWDLDLFPRVLPSLATPVKSRNVLDSVLMRGLILDTSTKKAILGVIEDGTLKSTLLLDGGRGLSSALFPALKPLVHDLSYIAVGVGPGSYMGVRTGATVAKTLAYSKDIPLIEFSSILVSIPKDLTGSFVFVGDAKMGEHYLIEGLASDGKIQDLSSPKLIAKSALEEELPSGREIVGLEPIEPHLSWVTKEVCEAFSQNQTSQPEALSLQYIR